MSDMFPFTEKARLSVRGNRSMGKSGRNCCVSGPERLRKKVENPFPPNIAHTVISPIVSSVGFAGKAQVSIVSAHSSSIRRIVKTVPIIGPINLVGILVAFLGRSAIKSFPPVLLVPVAPCFPMPRHLVEKLCKRLEASFVLQDVVERQFVDDLNILALEFQLLRLLML